MYKCSICGKPTENIERWTTLKGKACSYSYCDECQDRRDFDLAVEHSYPFDVKGAQE